MAETGDNRIRLAFEGHVAIITVARPEKLNALDYAMVLALERAAHVIEAEPAVGEDRQSSVAAKAELHRDRLACLSGIYYRPVIYWLEEATKVVADNMCGRIRACAIILICDTNCHRICSNIDISM